MSKLRFFPGSPSLNLTRLLLLDSGWHNGVCLLYFALSYEVARLDLLGKDCPIDSSYQLSQENSNAKVSYQFLLERLEEEDGQKSQNEEESR